VEPVAALLPSRLTQDRSGDRECPQSRHFDPLPATSGIPPETDIVNAAMHVRRVPTQKSERAKGKSALPKERNAGRVASGLTKPRVGLSPGGAISQLKLPKTYTQSKAERFKPHFQMVIALRVVSRFHVRSVGTLMFKRGFDAYQNPGF
jgi:hypothetical protein